MKLCIHISVNSFMKQLMLLFMYATAKDIKQKNDNINGLTSRLQEKEKVTAEQCQNQIKQQKDLIDKLTGLINQGFPLISDLDKLPTPTL
jgi:DNA anti-recombination protein RmuC